MDSTTIDPRVEYLTRFGCAMREIGWVRPDLEGDELVAMARWLADTSVRIVDYAREQAGAGR